MKLGQVLFSQGFGTRRECAALIHAAEVTVHGTVCDDPDHEVDPEGLVFEVQGEPWPYRARALIAMNKPAGRECSQKPKHHPSVYGLLPAPLRRRDVQAIGRLDEDTTGLLLFTDDGTLIHRWTSPKRHIPKVYEVTCKHPVDDALVERLREGVVLLDAPDLVKAAACEATGAHTLRLTLTEGKYHQVKRMIAAVGNRVAALERSAFGPIGIDGLAAGAWRWADAAVDFPIAR